MAKGGGKGPPVRSGRGGPPKISAAHLQGKQTGGKRRKETGIKQPLPEPKSLLLGGKK